MKLICVFFLVFIVSCKKNNTSGNEQSIKLMIDDATAMEGNAGFTVFNFRLSLDRASSQPVTVTFSTQENSAKAGNDFISVTSQIVTLQPGEVEKNITIQVVGDEIREGDEQFNVLISGATNSVPQKFSAIGIISNDDTKVPIATSGFNAPSTYPGYTLSWSDDFNGPLLNTTVWSHQNGDGCPNLCGWGNNELEFYTNRPDNLFFQDGNLIIEARKESYNGRNYTSSKILTAGKKTIRYGRIDIRAQLPKGKGIWPAFWLLPQNNVHGGWPKSGEIDLMELVGHEPNKVYGTLHYGPGPGSTMINRGYTLPSGTFNDEFHVFSIEWKQDQIKWFVDGNLFSTINKSDIGNNVYPFNEDFYLIFNLAVGGNWPGSPDASTNFPQWLIVDYIRVYQ